MKELKAEKEKEPRNKDLEMTSESNKDTGRTDNSALGVMIPASAALTYPASAEPTTPQDSATDR